MSIYAWGWSYLFEERICLIEYFLFFSIGSCFYKIWLYSSDDSESIFYEILHSSEIRHSFSLHEDVFYILELSFFFWSYGIMIFEKKILYFLDSRVNNSSIVSYLFKDLWRYILHIGFFFCLYSFLTCIESHTLLVHHISIFHFCCDHLFLSFCHSLSSIYIYDSITKIVYEFFICLKYIYRLDFSWFCLSIYDSIKKEKISSACLREFLCIIGYFLYLHDRVSLSVQKSSCLIYIWCGKRKCKFLISFGTDSSKLHILFR